MIQCVGCRNEDSNYCARICCSESVKNALKLKENEPDMDVYILFRDMRTYGFNEDYLPGGGKQGRQVHPLRAAGQTGGGAGQGGGRPGRPEGDVDGLCPRQEARARCRHASPWPLRSFPCRQTATYARLFKVPLNPDGFFQEAHVKLRPVDFAADGVYLCGTAHYPKHMPETISQAYGAAGRAVTLLSKDSVIASGSVCEVDENDCVSCGACITVCKYGAIEFYDTPQGKKARVNPVLCKGDGLCNPKCPTGAISLKHFTDDEIARQMDEAVPALARTFG